ncbi:MAG: UDP-N-acetylmuramate dehydrogenase [Nitrospinales bacterium]
MSQKLDWLSRIKGEVKYDEPLAAHTSFRIGGDADVFIAPSGIEDLKIILAHTQGRPPFILGEGTNLLVKDGGIRGIVVSLKESFKTVGGVSFSKNREGREIAVMKAGSGVKMSYLAKYAARHSLTGMEGLAGIPGSLGGSLIMNAGAEGTEIGRVARSVTRVTADGEVQVLSREDLSFQYRKAVFPPGGGIIVEAEMELRRGDPLFIQENMDRYLRKRSLRQPLSLPNAGSIFKNPPGGNAGRLIESAGLKGFGIGDAAVSRKHANFIVNKGNARACEVLELIEHIQCVVKEKLGVELEKEIIVVGV